jgi:hypothetical protein
MEPIHGRAPSITVRHRGFPIMALLQHFHWPSESCARPGCALTENRIYRAMIFPRINFFSNSLVHPETRNEKKEEPQTTSNFERGERSGGIPRFGGKSRQKNLMNLFRKNKTSSKSDSNGSFSSMSSSSSSLSSRFSATSASRRSSDASPLTSGQLAAMKQAYARHCEEADGDCLAAVMAGALHDTPDFQGMRRKDIKQLVKNSLDYIASVSDGASNSSASVSSEAPSASSIGIRHNHVSDTRQLQQQAMSTVYDSLRAGYADDKEGLVVEMAGELRDRYAAFAGVSKKDAKVLVREFLEQRSGMEVQSAAPGASAPSPGAQAFRNKWQDTPFQLRVPSFEFTIDYGKGDGPKAVKELAQINPEGKSGVHDSSDEPVILPAPLDIEFASNKQCALYVKAMGLAHLHERRANGYTARVTEFDRIPLPGRPEHAPMATQAKDLMKQILASGSEGLERFDAALEQLNHDVGLFEPELVDVQADMAAWDVKANQNLELRAELLQMNADDLASDPTLQGLHNRMVSFTESEVDRGGRKQDRLRVEAQLKTNLPAWVQQALDTHNGNANAAKQEVHDRIRQCIDENLTGERWSGRRKEKTANTYIGQNERRIDKYLGEMSGSGMNRERGVNIARLTREVNAVTEQKWTPPIPSRSLKPGMKKESMTEASKHSLPSIPPQRRSATTGAIDTDNRPSVSTRPSAHVSAFRNKWESQPFKMGDLKISFPVRYDKTSGLGTVQKMNNAVQIKHFDETVLIRVPGDRQFASAEHYALYAQATCLAHLHARRATGYTVDINDHQTHSVPPASTHRRLANIARELAKQCLVTDSRNLKQIARSIDTLNTGIGWRKETNSVHTQIQKAVWKAKCADNAEVKRDLMQMSEQSASTDPLLLDIREGLYLEASAELQVAARKRDKQQAEPAIRQKLGDWVRAAVAENPADADDASDAVLNKMKDYCVEIFTGPVWNESKARSAAKTFFERLEDDIEAEIRTHMSVS